MRRRPLLAAPFLLAAPAFAQTKGGTLKLGLAGGSTTDSIDPRSYTDSVMISIGYALFNGLVENSAKNEALPELAENWEGRDGAAVWTFTLRKGVTFSNGKEFDADDAIYSMNLHRGETTSGGAASLKGVKEIKKLGSHQIEFVLDSGDADFPNLLTDYHLLVVPNGFTDWAKPVGTGCMELVSFEPGVRCALKRTRDYWKKGAGWLDGAEITVITDASARINALVSGQVDVINRADPKLVSLVERSPKLSVVRSPAGWHPVIAMALDRAPFDNADIRQAMKFAIDRKQVLKTFFNDYGVLGNDHPIPVSDPLSPLRTAAARLRRRQGGVPPQEVRPRVPAHDGAGVRGRLQRRRRHGDRVPGLGQEGGAEHRREARAGRRVLERRLAQGRLRAQLLGRPTDRDPDAGRRL